MRKINCILMVTCLLCVFCFLPTSSRGDIILDQSFEGNSLAYGVGMTSLGNIVHPVQTFTVGISGRLTEIDLEISGYPLASGNFLFGLLTTDISGAPTSNSLASIYYPIKDIAYAYNWVSFDLSSFNINVNTNEVLAISLSVPNAFTDDGGGWLGGYYPAELTYPYGALYVSVDGSPLEEKVGYDLNFRTYVNNNPVPEPTTMLLFGAGLVGLAGFGRKKFKK